MNLDMVFSHNSKCPVRPIGEGLVIMAPNGHTTHSLEDLGAFIWKQIDGQRNLQAILDAVLSEYDIDQETACEDLFSFMVQMQTADLVVMQ